LNVEQVLSDYMTVIQYIKMNINGAANSPVITFGGSYGGFLSAAMRIRYPNIVTGSIASSAPTVFANFVNGNAWFDTVSTIIEDLDTNCAKSINSSFLYLWNTILQGGTGMSNLQEELSLCEPVTNIVDGFWLMLYTKFAWSSSCEFNYPVPHPYIFGVPWPLQHLCSIVDNIQTIWTPIQAAMQLYYNSSSGVPPVPCFNYKQINYVPFIQMTPWLYLTCTEIVIPFAGTGIFGMPMPYSFKATVETCESRFNSIPDPAWTMEEFGLDNLKESASNIIFSNGQYDPTHSMSIQANVSDTVTLLYIENAAHGLDLYAETDNDPQSVIDARAIELQTIKKWITQK